MASPDPAPSTAKRHPIFARVIARISPAMDAQGAVEHRRALLSGLAGQVPEVGAGNGLNFAHYAPAETEMLAVEPEPYLRALAETAAQHVAIPIRVVDGTADALPSPDASMDAAVASLVLCSVPDQARALTELRRVLRPGGELRFFEHIRAATPAWPGSSGSPTSFGPPCWRLPHQPRHPDRHHYCRLPTHQHPAVPVPRQPAAVASRATRARGRPTAHPGPSQRATTWSSSDLPPGWPRALRRSSVSRNLR